MDLVLYFDFQKRREIHDVFINTTSIEVRHNGVVLVHSLPCILKQESTIDVDVCKLSQSFRIALPRLVILTSDFFYISDQKLDCNVFIIKAGSNVILINLN